MLTFSQIIEFSDSREHICKLNPLFKAVTFLMLENHFLVINKSFSYFVKTNKLTNLTIWIDISVYQGGLPCLTTLDIGGADGLTETGLRRILELTGPAFNKLYYQFIFPHPSSKISNNSIQTSQFFQKKIRRKRLSLLILSYSLNYIL